MAGDARAPKRETRTSRLRLPVVKKPVFARIPPGYHRNETAGTWVLRVADGKGGSWTKRIGPADDFGESDGQGVPTFCEAQQLAKDWACSEKGEGAPRAPLTVEVALEPIWRASKPGAGARPTMPVCAWNGSSCHALAQAGSRILHAASSKRGAMAWCGRAAALSNTAAAKTPPNGCSASSRRCSSTRWVVRRMVGRTIAPGGWFARSSGSAGLARCTSRPPRCCACSKAARIPVSVTR